MKRLSFVPALAVLASLAVALPAHAAPAPDAGGPGALLRYVGDPSSATGNAISNGDCDVNGDDLADAVVGAWFWDKAPNNNIGAAYVLLGGEGVDSSSLADPADAGAIRIDGPTDDPRSVGFAVGCLGDVNGDGLDDVGVGDYQANRAVVIFGAESFTSLSLDSLGDRGFAVRESGASSNLGFSLAAVGDIDDDGKDDFAVAGVAADTQGRNNNGRVWIVRGRDDISDLDLANPGDGVVLSVDGAIAEERLGVISRAGDVNGDGTDDFVLGSYTSTPWGSTIAAPGAAYVVFGGNTGSIDLAALGTKGFAIHGPKRQRDRLGVSVSGFGDLNGDGKADVLVGADGVNNAATGPRAGSVAVVLGSSSTDTVYTDPTVPQGESVYTCATPETLATSCAAPTRRGYWINGEVNSDSFGYSVAGIGDVNDDDLPDIAVGAYGFDPVNPANPPATMSGAGALYVLFGRASGSVQNLAGLTDVDGYRTEGLKAGDRLGRQVGQIGDFDGNGIRDIVAGADFASRSAATGAQNGELLVALMGRLKTKVVVSGPTTGRVFSDITLTATVSKPAGGSASVTAGTVAFTKGGSAIPGCESVAVSSGTASCTINDASESSQNYVAAYSGTPHLAASESAAHALAITKEPTTTSLEPSLLDARPGQLVQLRAGVVGESANDITTGAVRFSSEGSAITGCKSVEVSEGDAVCTTSWSAKGDVNVAAEYLGTDRVKESSSGETTISVGTDAVIKPSATPTFVYGTAPKPFTGEIRGFDAIPTGTVEVRKGSTVLGTATLSNGEYAVQLGSKALTPGGHTLTLVYSGDDRTRESERDIAVTVQKARSTVVLVLPSDGVTSRRAFTLGVRLYPRAVIRTGSVQIRIDGKTVKTIAVKGSTGTWRLALVGKGTRKITAVYLGSSTATTSWMTKALRVN